MREGRARSWPALLQKREQPSSLVPSFTCGTILRAKRRESEPKVTSIIGKFPLTYAPQFTGKDINDGERHNVSPLNSLDFPGLNRYTIFCIQNTVHTL